MQHSVDKPLTLSVKSQKIIIHVVMLFSSKLNDFSLLKHLFSACILLYIHMALKMNHNYLLHCGF